MSVFAVGLSIGVAIAFRIICKWSLLALGILLINWFVPAVFEIPVFAEQAFIFNIWYIVTICIAIIVPVSITIATLAGVRIPTGNTK